MEQVLVPAPTPYSPVPVSIPSAQVEKKPDGVGQRLLSLDVYRGLIMITLAFNGFGLAATADRHLKDNKDSSFWQEVKYQFSHAEWVGCGYWDLIQPSFMFMVGVAMAFSYLKRQQMGQSYARMLGHAMWRSVLLIFLGIFLISNGRDSTSWSLMNVLTQIGLGYTFLFLLWGRSLVTQVIVAAGCLVLTYMMYTWDPGAGIDLATGNKRMGVSPDWAQKHLQGVEPAWHKNANVGHAIDYLLLNQFPRAEKDHFYFSDGGYQTINFLPSLATMIFGLMCGELLRSRLPSWKKLLLLILGGVVGLLSGYFLDQLGICPLVKRIWTPSWALFSTGWCCLILAGLYGVVDVLAWRWWTWPLVVVGVNSIAIYCMSQLLKPWVSRTYKTHFGSDVFTNIGTSISQLFSPEQADNLGRLYQPTVEAVLVGLVFWLVCWWMYRQKIFIRI
jgi:heparan-alpha-glucosaminide N-acetyltransferase